ncbi:hypothetical protein BD309DRAFT_954629 [Dichomitus squalens]|nr:hypothetical protein BD309DRAFT_954629 [Dichomitus squalens]
MPPQPCSMSRANQLVFLTLSWFVLVVRQNVPSLEVPQHACRLQKAQVRRPTHVRIPHIMTEPPQPTSFGQQRHASAWTQDTKDPY